MHRAAPAHLLGAHLALRAGTAALAVGVEEHRGIDAPAKAVHLPIPDIGVGSRVAAAAVALENPSLRIHFANALDA